MKALVIAFSIFAAASAQALTLECHGVRNTEGSVTLTMNKSTKTARLSGQYSDEGEAKTDVAVQCTTKAATEKTYGKSTSLYYNTVTSKACGFKYLRTASTFLEEQSGLIALANSGGGDTHDSSGYAYEYFFCEQP